jgi:hypothetical protein
MGVGSTLDFKRWELFELYIPMATVKLRFETAISTRHCGRNTVRKDRTDARKSKTCLGAQVKRSPRANLFCRPLFPPGVLGEVARCHLPGFDLSSSEMLL